LKLRSSIHSIGVMFNHLGSAECDFAPRVGRRIDFIDRDCSGKACALSELMAAFNGFLKGKLIWRDERDPDRKVDCAF